MQRVVCLGLLAPLLSLTGCGGKKQEIDTARSALNAALESWKNAAPADSLRARTPAIEFVDDEQRAGCKLLNFEITDVRPYGDVLHGSATLSIQDRRGQTHTRKIVYSVALKNPIVIGRDPYF